MHSTLRMHRSLSFQPAILYGCCRRPEIPEKLWARTVPMSERCLAMQKQDMLGCKCYWELYVVAVASPSRDMVGCKCKTESYVAPVASPSSSKHVSGSGFDDDVLKQKRAGLRKLTVALKNCSVRVLAASSWDCQVGRRLAMGRGITHCFLPATGTCAESFMCE